MHTLLSKTKNLITIQTNLAEFPNDVVKRAIIAIARKILVTIYHILKTGEVFKPSDIADIETTKQQHIEYVKNNLRNAFNPLSHTCLSDEEILQIINKSNNSLQTD